MQPQKYLRQVDFTDRSGDDTDHAGINQELDAAATSINQIRDNLTQIQRDDGGLKNQVVTADALAPSAFDAVQASVNEATTSAQNASTSALTSATTANTARDAAIAAKTSSETARDASLLNANNASASASGALASKNAAAISETNALSSKNAAATSETNALSSKNAAAISETNAHNSELSSSASASSANASAIAAAASAVDAANSAAAAATALDNFDDRYLGAKTADPSVDNDGNALQLGALYTNTVSSKMRIYTSLGWVDASSAAVAALTTYEYVATAGQTVFSGNDANGVSLSYTVGGLIVSVNGSRLRPGDDYTATNGISITLTSAAMAGDEVLIDAFGNFTVADTYSRAQTDTFLAAKANQTTTYTKTETDTLLGGKLSSADGSVTYAKIQTVTAGKVLGRNTSGNGVVQELPIAVKANGSVGIGSNPPSDINDVSVTVGAIAHIQNTVGTQVSLTNNAYFNGTNWKAIANGYGHGALRLNAFGAGTFSIHLNDTTFNAGDVLSNMDGSDVKLYVGPNGELRFNSGYGYAAAAYGCRAWVNFNGTGTVAIRASGNVSSITDNGVGLYTVNFTNAMVDANYSVAGLGSTLWGTYRANITLPMTNSSTPVQYSTAGVRLAFDNEQSSNQQFDSAYCSVQIFR